MERNSAVGETISSPVTRISPNCEALQASQRIEAVFRFGCHYPCASKHADPAWQIDLYQRHAIVTGFILQKDVDRLPAADALVHVSATVIRADSPTEVQLWVRTLEPVESLGANACIFDLALPHWIINPAIVDQATALWATLPADDREFVNAVFSEREVLRKFLSAPGSCRHHHAHEGGCIEHSVQTAEIASAIAAESPHLDRDLLVTTALVHDAGKALEYEQSRNGQWYMSRVGKEIGHKVSGIALAATAMARCDTMKPRRKESLMHMMSCSYGPAWAGLRAPRIPEAHVFSSIDRLSAEAGVRTRTYA